MRRAQVVGAFIALVGFAIVVQQVFTDGRLVKLDRDLADGYGRHRLGNARAIAQLTGTGRLQTIAHAFTPLGDATLLLAGVGTLAFLLYWQGRRRESSFLVIVAIGGFLLDLVARVVIGHLRPDLPFPYFIISRYGLPSGHALDATACYGAILVVAWPGLARAQKLVAIVGTAVLVAGVSYSRVVLLAHNLSDVLAGIFLGLAWLLLAMAAFSLPRSDRLPSTA